MKQALRCSDVRCQAWRWWLGARTVYRQINLAGSGVIETNSYDDDPPSNSYFVGGVRGRVYLDLLTDDDQETTNIAQASKRAERIASMDNPKQCPVCHENDKEENGYMCSRCYYHYGRNPKLYPSWLSFLLDSYASERANDLKHLRQREE